MTVNLEDSRDAQERGWGPPCHPRKIVTVEAAGLAIPVDERIADLVEHGLVETRKAGYALHDGWCWGYACRHILNDPNKPMSNHAWALAIDLNAPTNGYGTTGDFPSRIDHKVWNPLGFRSGKDYHGTKDPMHKEFMGTPKDASELTNALGGPPKVRKPHRPPPYPGPLREGSHGHAVTLLQRALKVSPDGIYGPKTAAAVNAFKRANGLRPDGVARSAVWHRLFGRPHVVWQPR